jgi:hypothetical protein
MFQEILNDSLAQESDRLMAAELAGDSTVINDDLADALLAIVRDAEEPDKLRARAQCQKGVNRIPDLVNLPPLGVNAR